MYVEKGNEPDFRTLRLYFEGLERLKTWLNSNQWITKLLDSSIIAVVEGAQTQITPRNTQIQALKRMVRHFLKTGRSGHFNKILKNLCDLAKVFLNKHMAHVEELEESLSP